MRIGLLLAAFCFTLTACDSGSTLREDQPIEAVTIRDLPADPLTSTDPQTGRPVGTGRYTFFSLRTGEIVLRYDEADRSDSASTAWDLAFQGTHILINGGSSGPGQGGAVVLNVPFEELTEAPTPDALRLDGQHECPNGVRELRWLPRLARLDPYHYANSWAHDRCAHCRWALCQGTHLELLQGRT